MGNFGRIANSVAILVLFFTGSVRAGWWGMDWTQCGVNYPNGVYTAVFNRVIVPGDEATASGYSSVRAADEAEFSAHSMNSDTPRILLCDRRHDNRVTELAGHSGRIWCLAFSNDGKLLASGSEDKTVRLWDPLTRKPLATLQGHTGTVRCLVFSLDSRMLASCGPDKRIILWDVASRKRIATLRSDTDKIFWLLFDPNGKELASGEGTPPARDGAGFSFSRPPVKAQVKIWDLATGKHTLKSDFHGWTQELPEGKKAFSQWLGDVKLKF